MSSDQDVFLTTLSVCGKGAITFAFSGFYFYVVEMFHTAFRQRALGSASAVGRVGSLLSPYLGAPLVSLGQLHGENNHTRTVLNALLDPSVSFAC